LRYAGEAGHELVQANEGEDPGNSALCRNDQPHLATTGHRAPMRPYQHPEPGRITEAGTGHVHHDRGLPADVPLAEHRLLFDRVRRMISAGTVITGRPLVTWEGYLLSGIGVPFPS
jgi:hypothetical protein